MCPIPTKDEHLLSVKVPLFNRENSYSDHTAWASVKCIERHSWLICWAKERQDAQCWTPWICGCSLSLWRLSHIPHKPRQALAYHCVTSRRLPAARSEPWEPSILNGEVGILSHVWHSAAQHRTSECCVAECPKYTVQEKQSLNTDSHKPQNLFTVAHIVNGDCLLVDHTCWTSWRQPGVPCCPRWSRSLSL